MIGATACSVREAPPATSPLTTSNAKSVQKYHMTPASLFTGAPPGNSGQKEEMEKPRPSPAGPRKSQYAVFSARETSLVHPLKVDSRIREVHITLAVRLKSRITMLLKTNGPQQSCAIEGRPSPTHYQTERLPSVRHFTILDHIWTAGLTDHRSRALWGVDWESAAPLRLRLNQ